MMMMERVMDFLYEGPFKDPKIREEYERYLDRVAKEREDK